MAGDGGQEVVFGRGSGKRLAEADLVCGGKPSFRNLADCGFLCVDGVLFLPHGGFVGVRLLIGADDLFFELHI